MAKQIILTQNNFGIPIELQFMSNTNSPVDLTDKTVEVAISYDGTIIDVLQATISSYTDGTAYIVTTTRHTSNVGLYTSFWSVKDKYGYITAQEDLYYYVKGEYNGAETPGIEQDKEFLLDSYMKMAKYYSKIYYITYDRKDIHPACMYFLPLLPPPTVHPHRSAVSPVRSNSPSFPSAPRAFLPRQSHRRHHV